MPDPEKKEIKRLRKKLKAQERKNTEINHLLSVQRTIFANERTLMAYLRTALTIEGGGIAALKLSKHVYMETLGVVLIFIGLLLVAYSLFRYRQKQRLIEGHSGEFTPTSHEHDRINRKEVSGFGNVD